MKGFKGVTVNNQNPVQANAEYYIPAKDKSFFLDNQTGKESIYVIVARQRDNVLEDQYQQVLIAREEQNQEKLKLAQTTLNRAIKMRNLGGIAEDSTETELNWTESGEQFSTVLARLTSCDGCVSPLKFLHR
jgi:cytochrome c-type biogenesis protein CcmH/NrfG